MARCGWKGRGMFKRAALALPLLFLPLLQSQDDTVLRVRVRLVHLLVTAKDAAGKLVPDLVKEDFAIKDNGVPQNIAVFERQTEQPLSVSLLIDNSGSTAKDLKYEVDSVSRFV